MKLNKTLTTLIAGAAFGLSGQVMAAGTEAGTTIANEVTLQYDVSSITQTTTQSVDFVVDTRVEFTFENDETTPVIIIPNGSGYVASYTLASTSNDELGFDFTSADLATGSQSFAGGNVDDNVQLNSEISIFVEDGTTTGYQSAEDTQTNVRNLPKDGTATVYVVVTGTVPSSFEDADIAAISLTADATQADGTAITDASDAAFEKDTKQFVVVTGSQTDNTAFEVGSAKFTDPDDATDTNAFTLEVTVINDPLCDTGLASTSADDFSAGNCPDMAASYIPKAIPGAMVEYTLKAKNSGSAAATNVAFTKDLSTIGDTDSDSNIDLVQDTLDNVTVNFTGAGSATDNSTANVLDVDVDTFAVSDEITITFTAIVE